MDKKLETFEQNAQIESNEKMQKNHKGKKLLIASAIALTLAGASCSTPTGEDIARDREKIEVVANQLSYMIESRKDFVRKYNELLAQSQADPDNFALERSKSQIYDVIREYNRKIEKLGQKYLRKTQKLDSDILKSQDSRMNPKQPIDENTYDYLLTMVQ